MRTVLDAVADVLAERDLVVLKAIPRSEDHLLLDLRGADGSSVAGQWFASEERAATVFEQTRRGRVDHGVRLVGGSGVVLQPGGADRRLRSLAGLAAAPGSTLVAHRPEQRGVVRRAATGRPTTYTKVVRAKRLDRTVRGARLAVPGVATPRLLSVDERGAAVTLSELPGRTLFELLSDPQTSAQRLETVGRAVGRTVAHLHHATPPTDQARHDAMDELAVTERWVAHADRYGLLEGLPMDRLLASARERLSGQPTASALLHRDLHDKQLLVDADRVGLLDFDLAAVGEPALDLANLLVHLELRAVQGRCAPERAARCAAALLDGYEPAADWQRRVAAYQLTTRIRLACVYAFRPAHATAGGALLDPRSPGRLPVLEEVLT